MPISTFRIPHKNRPLNRALLGGPLENFGFAGKKKAHKHKLFCPVGLGTTPGLSRDFTGFVPGTNPVKTWDKPGYSPYFAQWKPDFTGTVSGTNPVCPCDSPGDEGRHRKFMRKEFMCLFRSLVFLALTEFWGSELSEFLPPYDRGPV